MNEKILDRVRKLLALATSSNVHEAAAAAAKAQELMSQYGIEEAALAVESGEEDGPVEVEDLHMFDGTKCQPWREYIASALAKANGCRTYSTKQPERRVVDGVQCVGELKATIKIVGPKDAAGLVRYMFAYLCNEVERLAKVHGHRSRNQYQVGRSWYNSFRLGAAVEIQARITQAAADERARVVQDAHSSGTAIVRVNAALARLDDRRAQVDARCRQLGTAPKAAPSVGNSEAFRRGKEAGRAVNLSRGSSPALGAGSRALPR